MSDGQAVVGVGVRESSMVDVFDLEVTAQDFQNLHIVKGLAHEVVHVAVERRRRSSSKVLAVTAMMGVFGRGRFA
jgi:hypothetical protein